MGWKAYIREKHIFNAIYSEYSLLNSVFTEYNQGIKIMYYQKDSVLAKMSFVVIKISYYKWIPPKI